MCGYIGGHRLLNGVACSRVLSNMYEFMKHLIVNVDDEERSVSQGK